MLICSPMVFARSLCGFKSVKCAAFRLCVIHNRQFSHRPICQFRNTKYSKSLIYGVNNRHSSRSNSDEMKVQVNNISIHVKKVGDGKHPLILLPGALGSFQTDFGPQIDGLSREKYTVIAWDPPGYGQSRPPERDFSGQFYQQDAEWAHQLMQVLGYKRYSVLGWSDGGIVGLIQASRYPDFVNKLVVWGCNAYVGSADMEMYKAVRDIDKWSERMKKPMVDMYGLENFRHLWTAWCDALLRIYKEDGGDICKSEVGNIQSDTLLIHGDKDAMVPMEHPLFLKEHIKNVKLIRMPEGKHNLHLRFAAEFNKIVEDFLDK